LTRIKNQFSEIGAVRGQEIRVYQCAPAVLAPVAAGPWFNRLCFYGEIHVHQRFISSAAEK
jgi:hypothetical protein